MHCNVSLENENNPLEMLIGRKHSIVMQIRFRHYQKLYFSL